MRLGTEDEHYSL
jgi:uncharacterized protein (DUF2249 family)